MAKESGYVQEEEEDLFPRPTPNNNDYSSSASGDGDDDEAPESVPLVTSKELALSKLRTAKGAAARQTSQEKERRRATDSLLKTQAAMRKERLAEIVDSLTRRPKASRNLTSLSTTTSPKRLVLEEDEASERDHQPQQKRMSVEVRPGECIVHLSSVRREAVRARQRRAVTLTRSREALLKLRTAAHRVDASVTMAKRRLGRPATKFALTAEEATVLRARLQTLVHPPRRLKLQQGNNNK